MKKVFKGSKTGMAVAAKSKNPKAGQATAQILKSISGGKILTLTDNYGGQGLYLRQH